jgi:pyridoxine/pyridoxamine 5'-phosphate oxidase
MTYRKHMLTEMSCQAPRVNDPDPLRQFEMWFAEARAAGVRPARGVHAPPGRFCRVGRR